MKSNWMSLFALLVAGAALYMSSGGKTNYGSFGALTARSISVVDENGEDIVHIANTTQGPGVWLRSPSGDITSLVAMRDQQCVTLLKKGSSISDLSIGYGNESEAALYWLDENEKLCILNLKDVIRLIDSRDSTIGK